MFILKYIHACTPDYKLNQIKRECNITLRNLEKVYLIFPSVNTKTVTSQYL